MRIKIITLLLTNALAVVVILYFIDYLGISDIYSKAREKLIGERSQPIEVDTTVKALTLIEKEEEKKLLESFNIRETELQGWEATLKQNEEDLKAKELELKQERQRLKLQRQKLAAEEDKKEAYDVKVQKLAEKFFNIPPEKAVERILALEDDLLILDILKAMDEYSLRTAQPNIVPYLFSLMPPEDSARLDKKYTLK